MCVSHQAINTKLNMFLLLISLIVLTSMIGNSNSLSQPISNFSHSAFFLVKSPISFKTMKKRKLKSEDESLLEDSFDIVTSASEPIAQNHSSSLQMTNELKHIAQTTEIVERRLR